MPVFAAHKTKLGRPTAFCRDWLLTAAFRDWAGNETHFPREVAEAALAHVVGDKAEQAYRRGDALEKRRGLMAAWASYCEPKKGDNVVQFKKSGDDDA